MDPLDKNEEHRSLLTDSKFKYESIEATSNTGISELDRPILGTFVGVFSRLDAYSGNKRYYSSDFWKSVLSRQSLKDDLNDGRMFGIFEHPMITDIENEQGQATMAHPKNAAFVTKELWIEGDNLMGRAYLLNTPLGRFLSSLFLAKDRNGLPLTKIYVSARGFSKKDYFDRNGIDVMNSNDYALPAFDATLTPGIAGTRVKWESQGSLNYLGDPEIIRQTRSEVLANNGARDSLIKELNLKNT